MGYRSEVSFVIVFQDVKLRNDYVNLVHAKKDEKLTEALEDCYIPSKQPIIFWHDTEWKWYDGFPDVEARKTLFNWAYELYGEYDEVGYKFVRIGEETGDVDEEERGAIEWEELYSVTTIQTPYPTNYRDTEETNNGR